jgi:hypothetical protein
MNFDVVVLVFGLFCACIDLCCSRIWHHDQSCKDPVFCVFGLGCVVVGLWIETNNVRLNLPFKLLSRHAKEARESVSVNYWEEWKKELKHPRYRKAIEKFVVALRKKEK